MKRIEKVVLTKAQVEDIVHDMGWETIDARALWRLARKESQAPGALRREWAAEHRRVQRQIARSYAKGGGQ